MRSSMGRALLDDSRTSRPQRTPLPSRCRESRSVPSRRLAPRTVGVAACVTRARSSRREDWRRSTRRPAVPRSGRASAIDRPKPPVRRAVGRRPSSAFIKLVPTEPETPALRSALTEWPELVSSEILIIEIHRVGARENRQGTDARRAPPRRHGALDGTEQPRRAHAERSRRGNGDRRDALRHAISAGKPKRSTTSRVRKAVISAMRAPSMLSTTMSLATNASRSASQK